MIIVTAGKAFNDIDAFACVVAYNELLELEGEDSKAVLTGPLNHSVTKLALDQKAKYLTSYEPSNRDQFIYTDLSSPDHFAFSSDESQISEIFDHHYGWEEYWKEKIGDRCHIERVGAAATLIWEEYKKRNHASDISSSSANLLLIAILQNTLNFTSSETNDRDLTAFEELQQFSTLGDNWQSQYFEEFSTEIHNNFSETLRNDTKIFENFFENETLIYSQLEVTGDPEMLLKKFKDQIDSYWSKFKNRKTLINIIDIKTKTLLIYSDTPKWLHKRIKPLFDQVLESSDSWIKVPVHQRKQVIKMMMVK